MGYLYLALSKIFGATKMVAMKECGKQAKGVNNSLYINFLRTGICLIVSIITWLITKDATCNSTGYWIILLSGVATAIQLLTWILAAQIVSMSLLEIVCMIGSLVVPLILAPFLYNGDNVSLLQWIGVGTIVMATLCFFSSDKSKKITFKGILLMILASVGGGASLISQKLYITYGIVDSTIIDKGTFFNMLSFAVAFVLFTIVIIILKVINNNKNKKLIEQGLPIPPESNASIKTFFHNKLALLFICIAAISLYVCQIFSTMASILPSAVLYPLSYSSGFILTFLLDTFLYKEKISVKRIAGLVFVIASLILVTIK